TLLLDDGPRHGDLSEFQGIVDAAGIAEDGPPPVATPGVAKDGPTAWTPEQKATRRRELPDNELLRKAAEAANGEKFCRLYYKGDISDYGGDDSRADLGLVDLLAFWTGPDPERIERLFGQSQIGKREKWTGRADYRRSTVDKALSKLKTWYRQQPDLEVFGGADPP